MSEADTQVAKPVDWVFPRDVMAGLGGASRDLLATFLALLEKTTPWEETKKRIHAIEESLNSSIGRQKREYIAAVQERQKIWHTSRYSDDEMRLLLWMALREVFDLPSRFSHSISGCALLADDLVAAIIHRKYKRDAITGKLARGFKKQSQNVDSAPTFQSIVAESLDVLRQQHTDTPLESFKTDHEQDLDEHELVRVNSWLASQSPQQLAALANLIGVEKLNEQALRNFVAGAGAMSAISAGVSAAGFAAYILAAQASAFIPLVSGPGLVSALAVLSNPLTATVGIAGGGWWAYRSTREKMRAMVATQVTSLLAFQGVIAGVAGLRHTAVVFRQAADLRDSAAFLETSPLLTDKVIARYRQLGADLSGIPHAPALSMDQVHLARFDARSLSQRLKPDLPGHDSKQKDVRDVLALSGLTVGDALFAYASMDPAVVNAADFAYTADIDDQWDFAWLANSMTDKTAKAALGEETRLKGYVGEQMVASHLAAQGHAVSFPENSNEPGWDLLVDGQKYQVKFHESSDGIVDALERYDYPVIANTELMGKIPAAMADRVFFLDGLSNETVTKVTHEALAAGVDFSEPGDPSFALFVAACRSAKDVHQGKLSTAQAVEQLMLDGAVRAGLFAAGAVIGKTMGMFLFGPAGAWVLGGGLPILAQAARGKVVDQVRIRARSGAYAEWVGAVHQQLDRMQTDLIAALSDRIQQLNDKQSADPRNTVQRYLHWRIVDAMLYADECRHHIGAICKESHPLPEARLRELLLWAQRASIHAFRYQSALASVIEYLEQAPGVLDEAIHRHNQQKIGNTAKRLWNTAVSGVARKGSPNNEITNDSKH